MSEIFKDSKSGYVSAFFFMVIYGIYHYISAMIFCVAAGYVRAIQTFCSCLKGDFLLLYGQELVREVTMKNVYRKLIALSAVAFCVAGCTSVMYATDAVGTGYDDAEMKLSPCACLEIQQKPGLQEWSSAQI